MYKSIAELSFPDVISLYRKKLGAEKNGDARVLMRLYAVYPDLFTDEFIAFISEVQETACCLEAKSGVDFTPMFEPIQIN